MCCCMIETSPVPPWKSSATFGNLQQSSESVRKMFGNVRQAFRTILENFRKVVGNLRKIVKNVVISMFIANEPAERRRSAGEAAENSAA